MMIVLAVWFYEPGTWRLVWGAFDIRWLGLALLLLGVSVLLRVMRLRWLLGGRLTSRAAWRVQLWWEFASTVTPSSIGGAPVAIYFLARERVSVGVASSAALSVMLFEQLWLSTLLFVLFLGAWHLSVVPFGGAAGGAFSLALMVLWGWTLLLGYLLFVRPDWLSSSGQRICRIAFLRRHQALVRRELEELVRRARQLRQRPVGFLLKGYGITLAAWVARLGVLLAVVASLVPSADWKLLCFRQALLVLGGLFVPTPGGSGGVEGLFMLLVAPLLPRVFRVPVLVLWRFLTYYVFLLSGITLLTRHVQRRRLARPRGRLWIASRAGHPVS